MDAVDEILTANAIDLESLYGIGMGVPGPVEFSTGYPIHPHHAWLAQVPH